MYYAYVLKNGLGTLYKGSTGNLPVRINQHNGDINYPAFTKARGPWKLVYWEEFSTRSEAMIREKYFKTGKGREFIKKQITEQGS